MIPPSISVSNLAKEFGDRTLFSGASFQLDPGQRYGVVGANGSGKTTLLQVLAGDAEPTEGTVSIPRAARVGTLRQDHFLHEDEEILGVALMGNRELWEAMVEKERMLAETAEDPDRFDADRFSELEETVQHHDGYTAEARAARILEGLGIPGEVHRDPLSTLSGGFKLRVLLAQVLASAPDVLLLDEPTNHLDILSIRWLEKFLHEFQGPVAVISHDHRFLDNVATSILDLDYETITLYPGNYSDFERQKREERERREKEIAAREREIQHHQEFVDRFRAKASKARQAQSKLRMIEKKSEELVELPRSSRRYPTFRFEQSRPSGKEVLRIEGVRKAFGGGDDVEDGGPGRSGNEVLHGVDLTVNRGDRIAVLGPNGIGKSTLLKIVMGELEADAGTVEWGYEAHPGYFAQDHHEQLDDPDRTAEQWLWDFCPGKDRGFVRGHMGLVLFSGDEGQKRLSALSGGEAARLVFSRLALERPNVLVLDEPTNHLDLESIEALVEGLKAFDGTLILVSHDRWFVRELATRIVEIRPDDVLDYPGTYEEYVHHCGDDHLDVDEVVLKAKEAGRGKGSGRGSTDVSGQAPADVPGESSAGASGRASENGREAGLDGLSKNERRRRRRGLEKRSEAIATAIQEAEARIAELDEIFCEPGFFEEASEDEIAARNEERARLKEELDRLFQEWEEVEEARDARPVR